LGLSDTYSVKLFIYSFYLPIVMKLHQAPMTEMFSAVSRIKHVLLCIADLPTYDSEEIPIDDIDEIEEMEEAKADDHTRDDA